VNDPVADEARQIQSEIDAFNKELDGLLARRDAGETALDGEIANFYFQIWQLECAKNALFGIASPPFGG
jgi:hypothetical protein